MRWTPGGRSGDLEDRRGMSVAGGGLRIGAGGAVLLLVLSLVTGQNFFAILGNVIDTGPQDGQVSAAAFSPDGSELALQQDGDDGELSVADLASGSRRAIEAEGVLAGPAAWSPDGRLLAMTTLRSAGAPPPLRPAVGAALPRTSSGWKSRAYG